MNGRALVHVGLPRPVQQVDIGRALDLQRVPISLHQLTIHVLQQVS